MSDFLPVQTGTTNRNTSESLTKLLPALITAKKSFKKVLRTSVGQVGQAKTRYADLAEVLDSVEPALLDNDLVIIGDVSTNLEATPPVLTVRVTLFHASGEFIANEASLTFSGAAQQMGSAQTYLRRYLHLALCGIAPDDDDDGSAHQAPQRGQRLQDNGVEQYVVDTMNRLPEAERSEAKAKLVKDLGMPSTIKSRSEFDAWYKAYILKAAGFVAGAESVEEPQDEVLGGDDFDAQMEQALAEVEAGTTAPLPQTAPTQVEETSPAAEDADLAARVGALLAKVMELPTKEKAALGKKIATTGLKSADPATYTEERIVVCERLVSEATKSTNESLYDRIQKQDENTQGEIIEQLVMHDLKFEDLVAGTMSEENMAIATSLVDTVLAGY